MLRLILLALTNRRTAARGCGCLSGRQWRTPGDQGCRGRGGHWVFFGWCRQLWKGVCITRLSWSLFEGLQLPQLDWPAVWADTHVRKSHHSQGRFHHINIYLGPSLCCYSFCEVFIISFCLLISHMHNKEYNNNQSKLRL